MTIQLAVIFPAEAIIEALPSFKAVTFPVLSTVNTFESDEDHVIVLSVALSGLTVATRVTVSPSLSLTDV